MSARRGRGDAEGPDGEGRPGEAGSRRRPGSPGAPPAPSRPAACRRRRPDPAAPGGQRAGAWLRGALLAALTAVAAGCASGRPPVPLRAEPVPYADTLPIPEPRARSSTETARLVDEALWEELTEPFDLRKLTGRRREALNVTRFDDVVASSWWQPRIGDGGMTPGQVRRGGTGAGPDTSRTLTVVAGKSAGVTPGFTVRDARGDTYLFKFDPPGFLHLASSADVIASRIFWAAGYNTPEEYKVAFDRGRLSLDPDATVETSRGERAMARADVRGILERVDTLPDGPHVALASRFVPGTPKGPFYFSGTREDDPNDHYLHQFRRELRGLYVLAAWVNHFDLRFANTLTSYVPSGYLRHYLIDFAGSLGSETLQPHRPRSGREHNFDLWAVAGRLATLGFYRAGWEGEEAEVIDPSVGWLRAEGFDPAAWHPNWPNEAFRQMTVRDAYWGAKLVAAFDDADVRAAVEAGGLPRAAAADTLVEILLHRRDRTVEHWFSRVTPLEEPRAEPTADRGVRVTFEDLGLREGLWSAGETRYRWRFRHEARGVELNGRTGARAPGRQRVEVPPSAAGPLDDPSPRAALATLEVTALRPGARERAAVIHLRWSGAERGWVVAGLEH